MKYDSNLTNQCVHSAVINNCRQIKKNEVWVASSDIMFRRYFVKLGRMIQKMKGGDADISVHFPSKLGYQTILCTQVVFCFGPTTSLVTEYKLISISE